MAKNEMAVIKKEVVDVIEKKVNDSLKNSSLVLPRDYAVGNAFKAAWLMLQNTLDKNKNKALDVCSRDSIGRALMEMATKGLNPMRKQCYFIVRGDQLCLDTSYLGNIFLAKRAGLKQVSAIIVYEKDIVKTKIENSKYTVTSHEQDFFGDHGKAKGGYATAYFEDESLNATELMTFEEIQSAWKQGYGYKGENGTSVHNKFQSEMMKKTLINRVLKKIIGGSGDGYMDAELAADVEVSDAIKTEANTKSIDFDSVNLETGEILDAEENKEEIPATPANEEEVPF